MYECERLFGLERGAEVQAVVERALKGPCPCKSGQPCLLRKRADASFAPLPLPHPAA